MKPLLQRTFFTLLLLTGIIQGYAQIGINTDDPDESAILDIEADKKGVLFPRIEQGDIEDMPEKDALFYYNNHTKRFYYYNASKANWQCINPFNSTEPSQIQAPGNLEVNSNLTVENNQTVKNKLTVESKTESNEVMKVDQNEIKLNKKVDVNDTMSVKKDLTVEEGEIKGRGSAPVGTIVMWGLDDTTKIPENWDICDGRGETPDLTDKFIIGGYTNYRDGKIQYKNKNKYTSEPADCETDSNQYYIRAKITIHYNNGNTVFYNPPETMEAKIYKANSRSKAKDKAEEDDLCIKDIDKIEELDDFSDESIDPEEIDDNEWSCTVEVESEEENPDYYIDNSNCISEGYKEVPRYKLIFIMRTE